MRSNWYQKRIKEMGYKGCRNCKHQIEPLRGCEWIERGGDGIVHLICPKWEKKEKEKKQAYDFTITCLTGNVDKLTHKLEKFLSDEVGAENWTMCRELIEEEE